MSLPNEMHSLVTLCIESNKVILVGNVFIVLLAHVKVMN